MFALSLLRSGHSLTHILTTAPDTCDQVDHKGDVFFSVFVKEFRFFYLREEEKLMYSNQLFYK